MPTPVVAIGPPPSTDMAGGAVAAPPVGFEHVLRTVDPHAVPSIPLSAMLDGQAQQAAPGSSLAVSTADARQPIDAASAPPNALAGDDWGRAVDLRPSFDPTTHGASVLAAGERYLGVPYKWGGTDARTGFDCSGFVQQVYADLGIQLPRVSADQARVGTPVDALQQAQPGDLLFWAGNGDRPNHIAIYAGEGTMLVAPRTGDVVRYQQVTRTPDHITRVLPAPAEPSAGAA